MQLSHLYGRILLSFLGALIRYSGPRETVSLLVNYLTIYKLTLGSSSDCRVSKVRRVLPYIVILDNIVNISARGLLVRAPDCSGEWYVVLNGTRDI